MESENKGWNEQDLNELFSTIDVNRIRKPFNEYLDALDALFTEYQVDQANSQFRYYKSFDAEGLTEDDAKFALKALALAGHDENSLHGENVVLFREPVIVSELKSSNYPHDENSGALELVSYKGFDKKFIIKRQTSTIDDELVTTYQVHEMALGIILPKYVDLVSVKFTSYQILLQEPKKLKSAQKALKNAQELPAIEIQSIIKKFADINTLIRISAEKMNSVQANIHLLEQERLNNETNIESTRKSLEKVQKDYDVASRSYQKLNSDISEKEDQLEDVEADLHAMKSAHEAQKAKLKSTELEVVQENDKLMSLRKDLADARRETNLTTLDTAGHSKETARQLVAYYCFAAITFIGLAVMAVYVYWNGQNFSDTIYLYHVSSWDILLSRLPLVAATTLIIGGLSGVFFYLIKHIVSLNTEKMTMLKAGILAEQITNSLDCKNMTEEEILEFKRDTKIELIMKVFSKQETDKDTNNLIIEALKAVNSK